MTPHPSFDARTFGYGVMREHRSFHLEAKTVFLKESAGCRFGSDSSRCCGWQRTQPRAKEHRHTQNTHPTAVAGVRELLGAL